MAELEATIAGLKETLLSTSSKIATDTVPLTETHIQSAEVGVFATEIAMLQKKVSEMVRNTYFLLL